VSEDRSDRLRSLIPICPSKDRSAHHSTTALSSITHAAVFGLPFVKWFNLCYRTVVLSVCPVWTSRWFRCERLCSSAYCFLHQLRQVVRSVLVDAAKTVVHAFIPSVLDYCNSLLYGIGNILLQRLQAIHAARLDTGTQRCDNIFPVSQQLHWLPM